MKNISRRVFIKGMAVAAVATAASTVLTGCNLPVTPEKPVEPATSNVLTFTDPASSKNTLTVTAGEMVKGNSVFGDANKVAIKMTFENKMGKTINVTNAPSTDGDYYVVVEAYVDGYTGKTVTPSGLNGTLTDGLVVINNMVLDLSSYKTASTVTVKVSVKKVVDNTKSIVKTMESNEVVYTL